LTDLRRLRLAAEHVWEVIEDSLKQAEGRKNAEEAAAHEQQRVLQEQESMVESPAPESAVSKFTSGSYLFHRISLLRTEH
jgi:hypothetical protein